mmetsp:Transcript_5424/g.20372  ORF Transcript_5424/g.20372 Transcript_5424/m.20372 type:complete len:581 (+) Transcript_5424:601-2343(+)
MTRVAEGSAVPVHRYRKTSAWVPTRVAPAATDFGSEYVAAETCGALSDAASASRSSAWYRLADIATWTSASSAPVSFGAWPRVTENAAATDPSSALATSGSMTGAPSIVVAGGVAFAVELPSALSADDSRRRCLERRLDPTRSLLLAAATEASGLTVELSVALPEPNDGGFDRSTSESESRCTSIAPLIVAAALSVVSTGAGREDLARSKPVVASSPSSAVDFDTSRGTATTAAIADTYVDSASGSISMPPAASSMARVAASATAIMAPARISRLASTSSPSPRVGAPLRAATAATTAAARIDGSPTLIAVSSARLAALVSSPLGVGRTRTVPSTRADAPNAFAASATANIRTKSLETFAGSKPETEVAVDPTSNLTSTSRPFAPDATYPSVYLRDPPPQPSVEIVNAVSSASPSAGVADTTPRSGGPTTETSPVDAKPSADCPSCLALSVKTYFSPGTSTFSLIVRCGESTGVAKRLSSVKSSGGEDDHETRIFPSPAPVALFTEPLKRSGAVEDTVAGSGVATFTTGTGSFTAVTMVENESVSPAFWYVSVNLYRGPMRIFSPTPRTKLPLDSNNLSS